jgi:hypothetical protein
MSNAIEIVMLAFTVANSLRVVAYVPQILRICHDNTGAAAISCCTWSLFLVSHLTTVAYAVVVIGDSWMALVFAANAACSATIVALALLQRQRRRTLARRVVPYVGAVEQVARIERSGTRNPTFR